MVSFSVLTVGVGAILVVLLVAVVVLHQPISKQEAPL